MATLTTDRPKRQFLQGYMTTTGALASAVVGALLAFNVITEDQAGPLTRLILVLAPAAVSLYGRWRRENRPADAE